MKKRSFYITLVFPLLLFVAGLITVYPYYQYYIDPDAVAYLTIAGRYAAGDIQTAVNGYWSPWSCWLTALLIRQGIEAFKAAIIINAIGGLGVLGISHILFMRLIKDKLTGSVLSSTLALFLIYAVVKQSFDDLWYIFFLLTALLLMLKRSFPANPVLWVAAGISGALAYFSKAYAFPYFLLSVTVVTALLVKKSAAVFDYKKWLGISGVVIFCLLAVSAPWLWLLHEKYGRWMTATSGSLNLSWYLVGHPFFREGINLLIPPVYADAIYYWEDPYLVNGVTPYFWNSPRLFLVQIVRFGYTLLKFVNSMNELSAFFLPLSISAALVVFVKKIRRMFSQDVFILCVVFLLFPLGYLLINFESRYLWYLLPLSMILGALWIEKLDIFLNKKPLRLLTAIFCISYLVFPVWDMKTLYRVGETEYHLAQELKKRGIHGSFASNICQLQPMQEVIRVAYFSENPLYYMPWAPSRPGVLLAELRRYQVQYYFHFHEPFEGRIINFLDEAGAPFPLVFEDTAHLGLKVYKITADR